MKPYCLKYIVLTTVLASKQKNRERKKASELGLQIRLNGIQIK